MSQSQFTRRGVAAVTATGIAAVGLRGASAKSASAYQGNMVWNTHYHRSIKPSVRCGNPPQTRAAIGPERWIWSGKRSMKPRPASRSPTSMAVAAVNSTGRVRPGGACPAKTCDGRSTKRFAPQSSHSAPGLFVSKMWFFRNSIKNTFTRSAASVRVSSFDQSRQQVR